MVRFATMNAAIVIAATFTADPVREPIEFWLEDLGLPHSVRLAPYGQVLEPLLDPRGPFATNGAGFNVLLVRPSDWRGDGEPDTVVAGRATRFLEALGAAAARDAARYVLVVCPTEGPEAWRLIEGAGQFSGVTVLDAARAAELYAVEDLFDRELERTAGIPYTDEAFAAIGTAVARVIAAHSAPSRKVVALDADYTLWRGACGEDGPDGVVVSEPYAELQRFMLRLREQGMLLCLCSRNDEPDLAAALSRADNILRPEHFTARSVGWESKAEHLAKLGAELGLGLDGFILVDDDPAQIAEVRALLPEVLTVQLPRDEHEIPATLAHVWAFDRIRVTDEDRARANGYSADAARRNAVGSLSRDDIFEVLGTRVLARRAQQSDVPRLAQLLERTNQFRTTDYRPSESQLRAVLESDAAWCTTITVADDFGDYGVVGVVIASADGGTLAVKNMAVSCRVLDRGIESRILSDILGRAADYGCAHVAFEFVPTAKNEPARRFVESVVSASVSRTEVATYVASAEAARLRTATA